MGGMDEMEALRTAARKHQQYLGARAELHAAILAALAAGCRVTDVARESGYQREQVRRIRLAATQS